MLARRGGAESKTEDAEKNLSKCPKISSLLLHGWLKKAGVWQGSLFCFQLKY